MNKDKPLSAFFTTMQAAKRPQLTIIKRHEPGWRDHSVYNGLFPSQAQKPWLNNKRSGS